jgi:transcriptional regulator with XRE-family HTH domain
VSDGDPNALGRRVAFFRKQRGLSQRAFAEMVGRSETWVSQVERGTRQIDRMSVLQALADALNVPLAELAAESPVIAATHQRPDAAIDISLALSSSDALFAVLHEHVKPDVDRLANEVARAWGLAHGSHYDELSQLLVGLLPQLESAVRATTGRTQRAMYASLARAYHACAGVLAKMAEPAAAWVAADRAIAAAERAGDPLLMAEGAFRLALVFQASRRFAQVRRTASTAVAALDSRAASGEVAALSLWGALHLQLAIAAARQNDAHTAYTHLDLARTGADRLGADRNDYETEFGPTNVELHTVAVAVELGDAGRALRTAEVLDASALSPERRGRLLIDVARAHAQRRNVAGAIAAIAEAQQLTPEQVDAHPMVGATVRDLLRSEQGRDPDLKALAARLQISS